MPEESGDLVVQTRSHRRFGWILIPLEVGGDVIFDVVLSTYSPLSSLNDNRCSVLVNLGFADDLGTRTCLLRTLRIQGQPTRTCESAGGGPFPNLPRKVFWVSIS